MYDDNTGTGGAPRTVVIGAGMGGLSAAMHLQARGHAVTVFDAHTWPGGKMRTVASDAGPIDAGPTVLTMRDVFDDMFAATGTKLDDHVSLIQEDLLARHFWPDGTRLDLTSDHAMNAETILRFSGKRAASDYLAFSKEAADLFALFSAPMMRRAEPQITELARAALRKPRHLGVLSPMAKLRRHLNKRFSDPRLSQLFGRYATYIGGSPLAAPALLLLIWQAEVAGVWRVDGGMHTLASAIADRFRVMGGVLRLGEPVAEVKAGGNEVSGVVLCSGQTVTAETVVYAGDPRALALGMLGKSISHIAPQTLTSPRSLSARVWSFAANLNADTPLAHHNVFFGASPTAEFEDLAGGAIPADPTLYVCAEDRGQNRTTPEGAERFEIILNAAPLTEAQRPPDEEKICHQTTFQTLDRFGLSFSPSPNAANLSTPSTFEALFPGSAGSIYGQSPHGMMAALKRPRARTKIRGLYLAGGGTHPGAGVPMAALSGQHAAEAILKDHVLT
ncbi:MAG: 1-hydroxycarotenoid 3,4-desaturase CrtD [Pseudomonadota bacterium]